MLNEFRLTAYGVQHRGGKGKMGMTALEGDDCSRCVCCKTHDMLLILHQSWAVFIA